MEVVIEELETKLVERGKRKKWEDNKYSRTSKKAGVNLWWIIEGSWKWK